MNSTEKFIMFLYVVMFLAIVPLWLTEKFYPDSHLDKAAQSLGESIWHLDQYLEEQKESSND